MVQEKDIEEDEVAQHMQSLKKESYKKQQKWIKDGNAIVAYYRRRIAVSGVDGAKTLDWRTKGIQNSFFNKVAAIIDKKCHSILDIGCGTGDFYLFLRRKKNRRITYSGIDLIPEFINVAEKKCPGCKFTVGNFIASSYQPNKFDVVMNLGGLNSRLSYHRDYLRASIDKMIRLSRRLVIFNAITSIRKGYFPKRNHHKIGHITVIPRTILRSVLATVCANNDMSFVMRSYQIIPGSTDSLVTVRHQ